MRPTFKKYSVLLLLSALVCAAPLALSAAGGGEGGHGEEDQSFNYALMHHLKDGFDVALPPHQTWWLNETFDFIPKVEVAGVQIDFTPTRHLLFFWISAALVLLMFLWGRRGYDETGVPKGGFSNFLEALVVFVRDDIAIPNIGKKDGPRYTPFLCSLFFLILVMNLIGLVPYGAGPTSNLMVTGSLAFCSLVMTQYAGMRAQGVAGYWAHLVPGGVPWFLYPIMIPIEIIGLFTKPFALMMRLYANMTAGHAVVIAFIGLIFMLETVAISPVAIGFATFIYLLKIFVSFLQAYLFAMLTALFIGLASHPH